jgi:hypothetical protein
VKKILIIRSGVAFLAMVCITIALVFFGRTLPVFNTIMVTNDMNETEQDLHQELEHFFNRRTAMLISGQCGGLEEFYDVTEITGQWALESEQARIEYVQEWSQKRDLILLNGNCSLAVVNLEVREDKALASVCPHIIVTYKHGKGKRLNIMGARTVHWLELVRRDGRWLVQKDWFLDPFEGGRTVAALQQPVPTGEINDAMTVAAVRDNLVPASTTAYNRQQAVQYANRYAGVRVGPTTGRYNQDYRDYSLGGGDCANFASQVLADEEAGDLAQDWTWYYGANGGSVAWVQAQAFVDYFLGSGRAECVMRGSFAEVTTPTADYPRGAIRELQPGDIIGYEIDGCICHVSVVVGLDSGGYVLVNSHSADRLQMPWDLGYDRNTTFWLLKIAE